MKEYSIGTKIKKIRKLRGLTQKELGLMCGFPEATASTRIRHYESNIRVPQNDMLETIAKALNVNILSLKHPSLDDANTTMHLLFDMAEFCNFEIQRDNNGNPCFICHDKEILNYMNMWLLEYEKMIFDTNINVLEPTLADKSINAYKDWILNFPESISDVEAKKTELKLRISELQHHLDELNKFDL